MYRPSSGGSGIQSFALDGINLDHRYWHHIALTVFQEDAAIYVNGSVAGVQALVGPIMDDPSRDIKLGQIDSGMSYITLCCAVLK